MLDVVIIGAGTAGMSAGIYAARSGKTALILEKKAYGGQIINTPNVENYPGIKSISGFAFATGLYEQVTALGVKVAFEEAVSIEDCGDYKVVNTNENSYETKAVIIATGAKNRQLGIDREEQFTGAGISYCATCDGAFFRGRDVAVIGGGNTAVEDALFLSNYCNKVYVILRRDVFRADPKDVEILKDKENVEFIYNSNIAKIHGENTVDGIELKDKEGKETFLKVQGIFVAIGQVPDNQSFQSLISIDDAGYVIASEDCKTNVEGIYTAGDCRTKSVRQLTTAASDGAVAALAACERINKN